ncbi:PREDICTED: proprotein convertase subtilisin/kexin type 7 [Cercocebus atys]|uniref:proprotein convertase subtilisin/kexin type 7 n=1 Tax=Cercocebus atys TaxID=9531 RepID=UPI0005F3FE6E|nr:PREDICTED: proprotein convertase subtilisin/kexin type 7 [Cercocebus atys]
MPKGRQKVPHLDAPLGLPTCLWLELAGLFLLVPWVMGLAGTGGPDGQGPGGPSWAVHLESLKGDGEEETLEQQADALAQAAGLVNAGRIGELQGHYLFVQPAGHRPALEVEAIRQHVEAVLAGHEAVRWHSEQRLLRRAKRSVHFNDPKYPQQWHLNNRRSPGRDINVTGVWERNVTGRGVTVVVVDDGVEHTIQDIAPNYSPEGSYDLNSDDPDPMPHPDVENGNHHGTRCAGEIAAVPNNSFCAVGVAYGSRIAGIRVLDGPLTDSMEAVAFNKHYQINDIYSCSWGPDDDGKTVDGPHQLGKAALQHGVIAGRQGFGSIFVVASGNGGQHNDNCNYDGYANSIYTVTIGAVDEEGHMPFYAEECASMLAVTFSGGDKMLRSIVTTDWDLQKGTGCTEGHTGTSAAAPLAAGMIALMLQVRPCLTWRDVQHIIVFTATRYEDRRAEWVTNEAGFSHSHQHGFGLLNAWRLVNAAKIWTSVPYLASYVSPMLKENKAIPQSPRSLEVLWNGKGFHTASTDWEPSPSVRCWGERARGTTRLVVRGCRLSLVPSHQALLSCLLSGPLCISECPQTESFPRGHRSEALLQILGGMESFQVGILRQWQLTLYGSVWSPVDIRDRQSLLESAMSGKHLHDDFALPCPPGLKIPEEDGYTITPNTLKTLVLVGCFTVFWTVYYMLEVYLSQRNVASNQVCRSGPCHWPHRSRKAKEEGTELESVPLCSSKDPDEVETESRGLSTASDLLVPDLLEQGDWSLSQNKSTLDCPHQHRDLLHGKEEQIC